MSTITRQPTSINSTEITNLISPVNYIDQYTSIQSYKILESIFNGNDGWSLKNLSKLVIVIGIDGFKKLIVNLTESLFTYLKTLLNDTKIFDSVIKQLKNIVGWIMQLFKRRPIMIQEIEQEIKYTNPINTVTIDFNPSISFWQWLYQLTIENNKKFNITYNTDTNYQLSQQNKNELHLVENWRNIKIYESDYEIIIPHSIEMKFTIAGDHKQLASIKNFGHTFFI